MYTSLLVAVLCLKVSQSHIIYVIPESQCPKDGSVCQTLDWYNQHSNGSFMASNTEVRFLEGIHKLTTSIAKVKNLYNVTITGFRKFSGLHKNIEGLQQPIISTIDCTAASGSPGLAFNLSEIHLNNISFESVVQRFLCVVNSALKLYHFNMGAISNCTVLW